jgi:hypothetical protein
VSRRAAAVAIAALGAAGAVAATWGLAGGPAARSVGAALLLVWGLSEAAVALLLVAYRFLGLDRETPPATALVVGAGLAAVLAVSATAVAAVATGALGDVARALVALLGAAAATLIVSVPFAGGAYALTAGAAALVAALAFALAPAWAVPWARPFAALLDLGPWRLP